jgi:hypothetical protein
MADPTSNLPQITNFVPRWGGAPPPAAVPVAPPAVPLPVSATPGEGNPLPPSMRGGATSALPSLPSGPVSGAPAAATQPAFPVLNASALQGVFNNGAGGGSQIAPGGIEVDRGGTVSRYDQGGNLVSGPGTPEEAAYNRLLAANPAGGTVPRTRRQFRAQRAARRVLMAVLEVARLVVFVTRRRPSRQASVCRTHAPRITSARRCSM